MRRMLLGAVIVLSAGPACQSDSGLGLIKRMRRQNAASDSSLVLIKDATFPDGRQQRWYDAVLPPGRRRLDIAPLDSSNGLLFRGDSLYEISRGTIANVRPFVDALSLLSYDAYAAPVETARRLADLGFDLHESHLTTWQERPTYVVGAAEGDSTSNQFWIDRDRLYLVRLIERRDQNEEPGKPPLIQEVRLEEYRQVDGRWIPAQLSYFHNGQRFLQERLEVHHPSSALDSIDFMPWPWLRPHWLSGVE